MVCMITLKESELKGFMELLKLDQIQLKRLMNEYLKKFYPKVVNTRDYIYAEGTIPIALVAHLDTVFSSPCDNIYYDPKMQVMFSPEGLGADDRAGVFSIIQILRSGLRPHVILTTDEEMGGLGAMRLAERACPFKDLRYMVELDRRGTTDCIFYECENYNFIEYIESFGFITNYGTFSDISWLCPQWKVAGVNLSVGYTNEHTQHETLSIKAMLSTIEKVKKMLTSSDIPKFEYIESEWSKKQYSKTYGSFNFGYEEIVCSKCHRLYTEEEMIPVVSNTGNTVFYCPDCVVDKVSWCTECGEAFESNGTDKSLCYFCEKKSEVNVNELHGHSKSV